VRRRLLRVLCPPNPNTIDCGPIGFFLTYSNRLGGANGGGGLSAESDTYDDGDIDGGGGLSAESDTYDDGDIDGSATGCGGRGFFLTYSNILGRSKVCSGGRGGGGGLDAATILETPDGIGMTHSLIVSISCSCNALNLIDRVGSLSNSLL